MSGWLLICGGAGSRNPTSNDIQYQPVTIVQLEPSVLHEVTKSRVVSYRAVAARMAAVMAAVEPRDIYEHLFRAFTTRLSKRPVSRW